MILQANAYIYGGIYRSAISTRRPIIILSRPNSTARALIAKYWLSIDVYGPTMYINEVLADNRAGCNALAGYFGHASYCKTYIDFPHKELLL